MVEPAIAAEGVSVERGGRAVLDSVSFRADRGAVLAVLGPNGAGKSTLLRAVTGLIPHHGTVRLEGEPLERLPASERARRVALVPQQTALRAGLSVREVVQQGRYARRRRFNGESAEDRECVEWAIETADLGGLTERAFPTLSGGEQRRAVIARALASGARILCLDEPASALDVRHALELYALLRALARKGYAIVIVLHELNDALLHADRALLLDRGRAVRSGATLDVLEPTSIREVYQVEAIEGAGLGFRLRGARA